MSPSMQILGLERLSLADRLELVHDLWDSIAAEVAATSLTDAQRQELDRRWAEHERDPKAAIPWTHIEADLLSRLQK